MDFWNSQIGRAVSTAYNYLAGRPDLQAQIESQASELEEQLSHQQAANRLLQDKTQLLDQVSSLEQREGAYKRAQEHFDRDLIKLRKEAERRDREVAGLETKLQGFSSLATSDIGAPLSRNAEE